MNIVFISLISFLLNFLFGRQRIHAPKFGWKWWLWIHASIPFLILLRLWLDAPAEYIPLFIALAVCGQYTGSWFPSRKKQ